MSSDAKVRVFISNACTIDYPKSLVEEYAKLSDAVRVAGGDKVHVSALLGEMCTFGFCTKIAEGTTTSMAKYMVLPFLIHKDSKLISVPRLVVLPLEFFE